MPVRARVAWHTRAPRARARLSRPARAASLCIASLSARTVRATTSSASAARARAPPRAAAAALPPAIPATP